MKKAPWVKWYPDQFLSGIAGLTAEEVGVYAFLLNLMYDRGGAITAELDRLGARLRMRPSSLLNVLRSLEDQDKIVMGDGYITNRRAETEIESREKILEKWQKNLSAPEQKIGVRSKKNNGGGLPLGAPPETPRAPETQIQNKKKKESMSPKRATLNGVDYSEEFEAKVWQPYPRKKGTSKHKAYQLWNMLNDANQQRVIAAIPLFAAEMKGREDSVIKHLERFISQRVYETYAVVSAESNVVPLEWHKTATRDQWTRALKIYEMDSNWRSAWGPKPGQDGCAVPQDLIEALPYHLHPDRNRSRSQVGVAENKGPEAV